MDLDYELPFKKDKITSVLSDPEYLTSVEDCLKDSENFKREFPYDLPQSYGFFSYLCEDGTLHQGPVHQFRGNIDDFNLPNPDENMRNIMEGAMEEDMVSDYHGSSEVSAIKSIQKGMEELREELATPICVSFYSNFVYGEINPESSQILSDIGQKPLDFYKDLRKFDYHSCHLVNDLSLISQGVFINGLKDPNQSDLIKIHAIEKNQKKYFNFEEVNRVCETMMMTNGHVKKIGVDFRDVCEGVELEDEITMLIEHFQIYKGEIDLIGRRASIERDN